MDVERCLLFLIVTAESQHKDAERFHEETPHDAEGICLAEQVYVAAAGDDGDHLQQNNRVHQAAARGEFPMWLSKPGYQDTILGEAVEHSIRADNGRIHRPRKDQDSDHDDEDMESK